MSPTQVRPPVARRFSELRADGWRRADIRAALDAGLLIRVRRDRYVEAGVADGFVTAARLGARLDCTSLLSHAGVFVRSRSDLHVQVTVGMSRTPPVPPDVVRHWRPTRARDTDLAADLVEALAQACRCQEPRDAIASLDSAWHLGLVDAADIRAIFRLLPVRYQVLRTLLDPRCESGPETLMRLLLRTLGCHVEVQVRIEGVGRVDFVVDGWLIVECDSRAHHDGWDAHARDRRRDMAAARRGYMTVRPLAEDIMFRRDQVRADLAGLLSSRLARAAGHNSARTPGI